MAYWRTVVVLCVSLLCARVHFMWVCYAKDLCIYINKLENPQGDMSQVWHGIQRCVMYWCAIVVSCVLACESIRFLRLLFHPPRKTICENELGRNFHDVKSFVLLFTNETQ